MLRDLLSSDVPRLLELAGEMHRDSVYSDFPLAEGRTEYVLKALIEAESAFSVCYDVDGIVGCMLGEVIVDPWVDVNVAADHVFFVTERARGTRAGPALLRAFDVWARSRDADVIRLSVYAGVNNDMACRVLEKLGYEAAGAVYKKEVG